MTQLWHVAMLTLCLLSDIHHVILWWRPKCSTHTLTCVKKTQNMFTTLELKRATGFVTVLHLVEIFHLIHLVPSPTPWEADRAWCCLIMVQLHQCTCRVTVVKQLNVSLALARFYVPCWMLSLAAWVSAFLLLFLLFSVWFLLLPEHFCGCPITITKIQRSLMLCFIFLIHSPPSLFLYCRE